MKNFAIYGLAAMFALSFAACDDYKEPNPAPQTNPQEPVFKATDVSVSGDLTAGKVYDLTQLQADGEMITVVTVKAEAALPTGCTLSGSVEISADDFETSYPVPASATKVVDEEAAYNVVISPADLEEVYFENISLKPDEKEIKVRVLPETVIDKQVAIIGGPTNYTVYTMIVKPEMRRSYLYTPGNTNGWSQESSQRLYGYDTVKFSGYAVLGGDFKFTTQPDWDGTNYGAGDEPGMLSDDGGAGNLSVSPEGLYWCEVNTETLKYSTYLVDTYGIIGDATPDGWNSSTPLTSSDFLVWKAAITMGEGKFKFRANNDWAVNLGGSMNDLTQGGDDIDSPGAGTYEVTLDLSSIPYSCTLVKK